MENNILTWNRADAILYDHLNKTFWRKVGEAGSTFDEELITFRRINKKNIKSHVSLLKTKSANYPSGIHVIYLMSCGRSVETNKAALTADQGQGGWNCKVAPSIKFCRLIKFD